MSHTLVIAGIAATLLLNLCASAVLLRATTLTINKKLVQLLLVWLLPLIGAVICISLHRSDAFHTQPAKTQQFFENVDSSGSDH